MTYLLYLKRSFAKRKKRTIILYIIIACTIALPLMVSVFRDSMVYGQLKSIEEVTRGQTYHILNAKEEYLPYFDNIPGLSAFYEDAVIYVKADDITKEDENDAALIGASNIIGDDNLVLNNMTYYGNDESSWHFTNQLWVVIGVIMCISLATAQSVYRNHLRKYASEIGILRSHGASRRQVCTIFLVEFILLFICSAITAIAFVSIVMKLLFATYLHIEKVQNLSWMIFHVDGVNTILCVVAFFAVLLIVVMLILRQGNRQLIVNLLSTTTSGDKAKRHKKGLKEKENVASSLANLFLKRTNSQFLSCLFISVSVIIVFTFISNYVYVNMYVANTPPEYEISIFRSTDAADASWASESSIAIIKELNGVESVRAIYRTDSSDYLLKDEQIPEEKAFIIGSDTYATTTIMAYSDLVSAEKSSAVHSSIYNAAVAGNHAYLRYNVGDYLTLLPLQALWEKGIVDEADLITLKVVEILDSDWTDRMLDIFINDELFEDIMGDRIASRLYIKLNNINQHKGIEATLRLMYPEPNYSLTNNYASYEQIQISTVGMYIMLFAVSFMMLAFALIILLMKMADYINEQQVLIDVLYTLGANRKDLMHAYIRQSGIMAGISIFISCLVGYELLLLFFEGSGYRLVITLLTVTIQAVAVFLIFFAYNLPIYVLMRKKLNSIYSMKGER